MYNDGTNWLLAFSLPEANHQRAECGPCMRYASTQVATKAVYKSITIYRSHLARFRFLQSKGVSYFRLFGRRMACPFWTPSPHAASAS